MNTNLPLQTGRYDRFTLNKLCGRPPQYAPVPCKLTFDRLTYLKSGIRVTCDMGYLCANFSLPRPLCYRLRPDVRDRQTDVRRASSLNAPTLGVGITITRQCNCHHLETDYYTPAPNSRGHKAMLSDVCLSVCLTSDSVAYIRPNSRTEKPRNTKIGTEEPTSHVTRTPLSRSKVKVIRPLYSSPRR